MSVQAVRRRVRQQPPSDPEVYFGACAFGNEGIGRLLDPVVEEGIRSLQTKNQPSADGIPQRSVDLLFFGLPQSGLPKSLTQQRHIGHVAETGELLESALRLVRQ